MGRVAQWLLIRRGEGSTVAYLGTLYLIIGLGMGVGHSSSDALFFKRVGVSYLPHMLLFISMALVIFSAVYAGYVDRVRSWRLFQILFIVVATFLLAAWMLMSHSVGFLGYALYFLGYSVISEILIMHFNLYASGFLDTSQSKRLSPLLYASARLGVIIGGVALGLTANLWPTEHMALAWAAFSLAALLLISYRHRQEPPLKNITYKRPHNVFAEIGEGVRFARHSSLLKLTGAGVFIMIILISVQDYLVSTILAAHYPDERSLAAFFGWFTAATNAAVLLLQLTTTNRLVQRFGLKTFNLIFPVSTIFSFALLSISASFIPALIARFNYRGMLHAFRNPAANTFYNALPNYMQGRARAMTLGLVLPLGLAAAGLLMIFLPKSLSAEPLALLGLGISGLYLYLKIRKNKIYSETLIALIQSQVYSNKRIDLSEFGQLDDEILEKIAVLLRNATEDEAIENYAEILLEVAPSKGALVLLHELPHFSFPLQDRLLQKLAPLRLTGGEEYLVNLLEIENFHLRATALKLLLGQGSHIAKERAQAWLVDPNPRLRSAAAGALLLHSPVDRATAQAVLLEMLSGNELDRVLSALEATRNSAELNFIPQVRALTLHVDTRVRIMSLLCLANLCAATAQDFDEELVRAQRDSIASIRVAAVQAATLHGNVNKRLEILCRALEDKEFSVRKAALSYSAACMPDTLEAYRAALYGYVDNFTMQSLLCDTLSSAEIAEKRTLLLEIGKKHLELAYQKKSIVICLQNLTARKTRGARDDNFLTIVLREEIQRHISLVLKILEGLDENQSVHAIRAALATGSRALRAQGLESLRHTQNNILLEMLLPLLDAEYDGAEWRFTLPDKLETTQEVREWCARVGSEWLRQCTASLKDAELKGT